MLFTAINCIESTRSSGISHKEYCWGSAHTRSLPLHSFSLNEGSPCKRDSRSLIGSWGFLHFLYSHKPKRSQNEQQHLLVVYDELLQELSLPSVFMSACQTVIIASISNFFCKYWSIFLIGVALMDFAYFLAFASALLALANSALLSQFPYK